MTTETKTEPLIVEDERLVSSLCSAEYALNNILSQIDEIYPEWEELCEEIDQENFCTDCEHIVILNEREEYWGSTCYREVPSCKAEFDPEDGDCPRCKEYEKLVEQKEAKQAELERLEALMEMLEGREGAKAV